MDLPRTVSYGGKAVGRPRHSLTHPSTVEAQGHSSPDNGSVEVALRVPSSERKARWFAPGLTLERCEV
jgi:hypothetical protein